jgi:uncharacterized integral membrane protein
VRLLAWLARVGLFALLLGFALSNTEPASLRFLGIAAFEWRAPLVVFLLVFFAAGIVLGAAAVMPRVLRQRRDLLRAQREATLSRRPADGAAAAPAASPGLPAARGAGPRGT